MPYLPRIRTATALSSVSIIALLALLARSASFAAEPAAFPVQISIDAGATKAEWKPIWRFFGADEPNYGTMKDGRALLSELGQLRPNAVYFRTHNLLCTGDGTPALKWGSTNAYTEDAQGKPIYNWTIVDHIFDTYRARGVRPYVQVGFMPEALSTHPEPYQHEWRPGLKYDEIETGWAYPPKDYAKWAELVYQWTKHCVERYGQAEVEQWYWEIWNEANGSYWKASPADFQKLQDYSVDAIRRALPTARVGGPDVAGAGGKFMRDFLEHITHGKNFATGATGTPTDFISFHAKGSPTFVEGHVRLGLAAQVKTVDQGFAMIAAVPELKGKPIVIGEADPDGCAACQGAQLGYRTGAIYASYTAAAIAREIELADRHAVNLEGALTWAFEFEDQPYFAGQRVLASNGINLPVLNIFRMLSRLGGQRVTVQSSSGVALDDLMKTGVRGHPDVTALATLEKNRLSVLAWHYHDDDVAGAAADVTFSLANLPAGAANAKLTEYRIDETHSNAFTAWQRLGSPPAPDEKQYAALAAAGALQTVSESPSELAMANGAAHIHLTLPRQAVSLLVISWGPQG